MSSRKNLNGIGNSDKLKNKAAPSSEEFFSLPTDAAEILIFVVLRVPLVFFISRDIGGLCLSPTIGGLSNSALSNPNGFPIFWCSNA
jgi:hypothetical protein